MSRDCEASQRRRILVVDPFFKVEGGGAAVAAWVLQALVEHHDVTVFSWKPPDVNALNRWYATTFTSDDFRTRCPPTALRILWEAINAMDPDPFSIQRWALLVRLLKRLRPRFDVVISVNDETDLGDLPGIQYVHYPYAARQYRAEQSSLWRKSLGRLRPWRLVSGWSFERLRRNVTLVNSDWTGNAFREAYGVRERVHTVFPPVPGDFPVVAWEEQEDGFVCVGRIVGDKRLDRIIDIVARVRERHPRFHLHIVGARLKGRAGESRYFEHIRGRVAEHPEWLFLEEGISRQELVQLLARHRYGVHAKENEHFGIAVAEMVKAGCLTFAHRSGGQVEILNDERLLYRDEEDAVARILAVIESTETQRSLRRHLEAQGKLFSSERFAQDIRRHVAAFPSGGVQ